MGYSYSDSMLLKANEHYVSLFQIGNNSKDVIGKKAVTTVIVCMLHNITDKALFEIEQQKTMQEISDNRLVQATALPMGKE